MFSLTIVAVFLCLKLIAGIAVPSNGLVAYYPLDGSGADGSGNGNNLGFYGTVKKDVDRFGNSDKALAFDGTTNYLKLTTGTPFDFVNDFAVSFWVKPSTTTASPQYIFSKYGYSPSSTGYGYAYISSFNFPSKTTSNTAVSVGMTGSSTKYPVNIWTHAALVKSGSQVLFYANGSLIRNSSFTTLSVIGLLSSGSASLLIGAKGTSTGQSNLFQGSLDEILFYNRSLTSQEVSQIYNVPAPGTLAKTGLVAAFTFNENANDGSGNNNNGAIIGNVSPVADRAGFANQAYNFDGTTGYISVPGTQLDFTGDFSAAFWFKTAQTSFSSNAYFFSKYGTTNSGYGFNLGTSPSLNYFFIMPTKTTVAQGAVFFSGVNFTANVWNHLAIVKNGTQEFLYVNGALAKNMTTSSWSPNIVSSGSAPFLIGAKKGPTNLFQGALDDMYFYNRSLTATEVNNIYRL